MSNDRSRSSAFGLSDDTLRDESGAFPIGEARAEAEQLEKLPELAPESVSLIPEPPPASLRPRGIAPSPSLRPPSEERAKLVIEDLSLRPDNPYLASSLVPPPESPTRKRNIALFAGGMLIATAVGGFAMFLALRAPASKPATPVATKMEAARAAPSAAPQLVAPSAPVVQAPVQAAEPSAPTPTVPPAPVAAARLAAAPGATAPQATAPSAPARSALPPPPEPKAESVSEPAVASASAPVAAVEPAAVPVAPASEPVAAPAEATPAAPVPERLTREQVAAGFDALRSELEQCAQGAHGVVQIDAAIAGSGRVAHALIGGDFVGKPEGSCMARAVRAARFPASAQPRTSVRYPIAL